MAIWQGLPAAAMVLLLAAPARAGEAADAFNSLYGEELKGVLATPSPADDLALAKQLLEAAKSAAGQPTFLGILCQNAYDLAVKDPGGYPTALAAMELLAEKVPEKKADCLSKCATLYQRQYATARGDSKTKAGEAWIQALMDTADAQGRAGDVDAAAAMLRQALTIATAVKSDSRADIQARLTGLASRQQMDRQLDALKAKLQADPKDAATRKEIVRLYLVERADPAKAAPFVDDSLDPATRKYVPAAARPIDEAPELACQELGKWYQDLSDQGTNPSSKAAMLRRAKAYYTRYLDLHTAQDLPQTAATLALKKVEDALAKVASAQPTTARPAGRPRKLLIFTLAKGFRHASTPLAAKTFEVLGAKSGAWTSLISEDPNLLAPASLKTFDGILMDNTAGEIFDDVALKTSLLDFVKAGKGIAGIHAAIDCFHQWPPFGDLMGAYYAGHPFRTVSVKLDDPASPLNAAFGGKGFGITDEIYSVGDPYSRDKLHVLLSVDWKNSGLTGGNRPDNDYALSWIREYGKGRVFYCAFGHEDPIFSNPALLRHFHAGILYILGDLKADATPSARLKVTPAPGPVLGGKP